MIPWNYILLIFNKDYTNIFLKKENKLKAKNKIHCDLKRMETFSVYSLDQNFGRLKNRIKNFR